MGGEIDGPRLRGRIRPVGSDRLVVRHDGVGVLDLRATFETDNGAVIDAPFLDTEKKVDAVFLAALTREPSPEERERFSSYVERGGPTGDKKKALADVFWVLLNSTEFLFNH